MKDLIKIFKALSDPTRLRILLLLLNRDLCVCELTFILDMEQSRISHQLRILRDADLLEDTREGKWIIYRIPESTQKELRNLLEDFLKERIKDSEDIKQDAENLEAFLKKEIRKKRCKND